MDTARRLPSYSRRPETVDHNREREREKDKKELVQFPVLFEKRLGAFIVL